MNFKMNTIFVLRILNYIILTIQCLWVFLSRTNLHFVNRVISYLPTVVPYLPTVVMDLGLICFGSNMSWD